MLFVWFDYYCNSGEVGSLVKNTVWLAKNVPNELWLLLIHVFNVSRIWIVLYRWSTSGLAVVCVTSKDVIVQTCNQFKPMDGSGPLNYKRLPQPQIGAKVIGHQPAVLDCHNQTTVNTNKAVHMNTVWLFWINSTTMELTGTMLLVITKNHSLAKRTMLFWNTSDTQTQTQTSESKHIYCIEKQKKKFDTKIAIN